MANFSFYFISWCQWDFMRHLYICQLTGIYINMMYYTFNAPQSVKHLIKLLGIYFASCFVGKLYIHLIVLYMFIVIRVSWQMWSVHQVQQLLLQDDTDVTEGEIWAAELSHWWWSATQKQPSLIHIPGSVTMANNLRKHHFSNNESPFYKETLGFRKHGTSWYDLTV